jgi:hypothetical protein
VKASDGGRLAAPNVHLRCLLRALNRLVVVMLEDVGPDTIDAMRFTSGEPQ